MLGGDEGRIYCRGKFSARGGNFKTRLGSLGFCVRRLGDVLATVFRTKC